MTLVKIGCPIWTHEQWFGSLFPANTAKEKSLAAYAQNFNSVEGNTSFYHIPDEKTVMRWAEQVPEDFRFTFKFHRSISHDKKLINIENDVHLFLSRMALLEDKLGCLMLQLPASFSPHQLGHLASFIALLPKNLRYAVEVRHLGFFDKSDNEKALNQLLIENNINRVIMDTRALFSCPVIGGPANGGPANGGPASRDKIIEDTQRKKPKVPTHVIATSETPLVRFVGHPDIQANKPFYSPWIHKTKQWLDEGKSPYLFFHMPNTFDAPWLAEAFVNDFKESYPEHPISSIALPKNSNNQLDIFGL